jgi:Protein of unknown function (DUF4435)
MKGRDRLGIRPLEHPARENLFFNTARAPITMLVESPSDSRFWQLFIRAEVLIRPMMGRENVIQELKSEAAVRTGRVVAVVDADLDRVRGTLQEWDGLIYTDAHDLETTVLGTRSLEKVVDFHKRDARVEDEQTWKESLRSRLFRHGEAMGRLRWLKIHRSPALDGLVWRRTAPGSSLPSATIRIVWGRAGRPP